MTNAPHLLPPLPVYPVIDQMCRVFASSSTPNVYHAYTEQYNGSLGFRDREPCFVTEPNSVLLGPGIYDCRLVGSLFGLPLYATTCCVSGSFSSSSSASSN